MAFTKQPGNLPDVITVANAVKQLPALGIKTTEIVTDNGYYSEQNLSRLFQAGFDFITLVRTSLKWVKPEIDRHMEELKGISSVCPSDTNTHGITVMLMHDFEKAVRMQAIKMAGRPHVSFDDKACAEAYKYHGYFVLVTNKEKEPFECLRKYRKRETIESFFEAGKQHADGQRVRVWDPDILRGLKEEKQYQVRLELNHLPDENKEVILERLPLCFRDGETITGAALQQVGLVIPRPMEDYGAWQIYICERTNSGIKE